MMRLFILDRTPLHCCDRIEEPPRAGDTVVYLRPAQDADGTAQTAMILSGINVLWGERLIDDASAAALDKLGGHFLNTWYRVGDTDISRAGSISIGKCFDAELGRLINPRFIVRTGEIVRRAMLQFSEASVVYTDLTSGEGLDRVTPRFLPLFEAASEVATTLGRGLHRFDAIDPVPPFVIRQCENRYTDILASWLGALRPAWLKARVRRKFGRRRSTHPILYAFIGRGTDLIVRELIKGGHFRIVVNRLDIPGANALRHDHLIALPRFAELYAACRTIRHIAAMAVRGRADKRYIFGGVDYGPILAAAAYAIVRSRVWPALVALAQTRALIRRVKCEAILLNGEGGFGSYGIVDSNIDSGVQIYLSRHGINVHKLGSIGTAHNSEHVTYLACGDDHIDEYGCHLPENRKPRRVSIGSPLVSMMEFPRLTRRTTHGRRLLVLGPGYLGHVTATRARTGERFLIDTFDLARKLSLEGWRTTYRGHPHHPHLLEHHIAEQMGLSEVIQFDDASSDLSVALLAHDVVISSLSSTLYQSLCAGWPTILYDPSCHPDTPPECHFNTDLFVGLPVARDIEWPFATDPKKLARLVRETLDPLSMTSRFPHRFVGELGRRFVGRHPTNAAQEIARFIERDFARPRSLVRTSLADVRPEGVA